VQKYTCGEKYYMYFIGNFMCFPAVIFFENWLRFDKVRADYKVIPFCVNTVYLKITVPIHGLSK